VSTNNESHRYVVLSSLLLLPPSYAQISPSAPYELSKTHGLCYFLNMRDQVSHPHTKTSAIVVLRYVHAHSKREAGYPGPNGSRIVSSCKNYERMPDVAATNIDWLQLVSLLPFEALAHDVTVCLVLSCNELYFKWWEELETRACPSVTFSSPSLVG
jgi:hypothetical protein